MASSRDRAGRGASAWIVPGPDGAVPDGYPIKVKVSSGIFHVPGGRFYERTTADRLYPNAAVGRGRGVPSIQVLIVRHRS